MKGNKKWDEGRIEPVCKRMTDCKYRCWKVKVKEAVVPVFIKELSKEDVAYRSVLPGRRIEVVVVTRYLLQKKIVERRWKAAIEVQPMDYEVFKQFKSEYVQIKFHSVERADYLRKLFTHIHN